MLLRRALPTPALTALALAALVCWGLAALVVVNASERDGHTHADDPCGHHPRIDVGPGPTACAHEDEPPAGVDPTVPVPTDVLAARVGGGAGAYAAAEELGVPSPTTLASNAATPDVTCDGDGTSGYRLQAMYVVEAGRTNRYAALSSSLKLWAAGVDDVVNRSAALTGGVRRLRWVTDTSGGTCTARVLNVTVPAGATASFSSTISAVQALGHTAAGRKYLMWTDATALCGVASMYTSDNETQANPNNGAYAQYARVDAGCWGFGNGSNQHSVEAHEVLHMLGGVQDSAPHSTKVGHCHDESDTMCYPDGGAYPMRQICPAEREYLFDCNNDDYFSTYPDPGGYLDTHWNAADSRFLLGGGDGSGGGVPGTPTTLGATIAVNNPAVPGLATQVSVAPSLPAGRTVASVVWKSARTDCVFSAPTELQSLVTCNATAATATSVTATVVDSTGASKVVSSPLTFATGTARPVTITVSGAGQTPVGGDITVCSGASFPLRGRVVDAASGQPVKGLATTWTKKTPLMLSASAAGSATTDVTGTATLSPTASTETRYTARTAAGGVYAAGAPSYVDALPIRCAPTLTVSKDMDAIYYGDPVVLSGNLTRTANGATVPVSGATLTARLTTVTSGVTKVTALTTVRTAADGSYRVTVKPTATGTLSVALASSTAYLPTTASAGGITVSVPQTRLAATNDRSDIGYGSTVTVTGVLERVAGTTVTGLSGRSLSVYVTPTGGSPVRVGGGSTGTNGGYSIAFPLKVSGSLRVSYAGAAGQPAATTVIGPVVAGRWTPTVTATASASSAAYSTAVTVTGSVTRTYQGTTQPAAGLRVGVYFRATGSSTRTLVASGTTGPAGSAAVRVYARASGTWTVEVRGQAGYSDASSAGLPITVT